jgi:GNAT superfamily N-acetyltransferase
MTPSAPADITITTDPSRFDLDVIHRFLARSYWAAGIPRETVERAIHHSLGFAALEGARQVGFARVISDHATYAYVSDVFVLPSHRGRGIGKRIMAAIVAHPALQGLRRWTLFTRDAHGLYRQYGFGEPRHPERLMEILGPPYSRATPAPGVEAGPGLARDASQGMRPPTFLSVPVPPGRIEPLEAAPRAPRARGRRPGRDATRRARP